MLVARTKTELEQVHCKQTLRGAVLMSAPVIIRIGAHMCVEAGRHPCSLDVVYGGVRPLAAELRSCMCC